MEPCWTNKIVACPSVGSRLAFFFRYVAGSRESGISTNVVVRSLEVGLGSHVQYGIGPIQIGIRGPMTCTCKVSTRVDSPELHGILGKSREVVVLNRKLFDGPSLIIASGEEGVKLTGF